MTRRTSPAAPPPSNRRTRPAHGARASAQPGRQEVRRNTTRRELVLAGRRLFGSEGIYESRIEDITDGAGMAKGTLYLHFSSKEDLLHAVTKDGLLELQAFVRERLEEHRKLPAMLAEMFTAHLVFFERNPDLMRILHQVRGALKFDHPPWRPLRTLLRLHVEYLAACLAQGEAQAWTPARRRGLAALLFGLASGSASVQASVYPDSSALAESGEAWAPPLAGAMLEISARSARTQAARARRARRARDE